MNKESLNIHESRREMLIYVPKFLNLLFSTVLYWKRVHLKAEILRLIFYFLFLFFFPFTNIHPYRFFSFTIPDILFQFPHGFHSEKTFEKISGNISHHQVQTIGAHLIVYVR